MLQINFFTNQKETHRLGEPTCGRVHTTIFKGITDGGLWPGSSADCYVAASMGREFGGERICVCVWLSPFAVHLKLTTLLTGYTPIQNKKFEVWKKIFLVFLYLCEISHKYQHFIIWSVSLRMFLDPREASQAFVRPCPDLGIRKHVSPAEEAEVSVGGLPSGGRSCAQVTRPQSFLTNPGKGPKLCLPDGLALGTKDLLTEARKDLSDMLTAKDAEWRKKEVYVSPSNSAGTCSPKLTQWARGPGHRLTPVTVRAPAVQG